jgi:hypothetical protein
MNILQPIDGFTPGTQRSVAPLSRTPESYMDFLKFFKVVKSMWERANPTIKIYHAGHEYFGPTFPCITLHVFSEKPAPNWPKPRPIEVIPGTSGCGKDLIQLGQFFELIIRADIYSTQDAGGAETAEEICEAFKRFMMDFTYVLIKKGIGNIQYTKRFVDENIVKIGDLYAVKRSLAYTAMTQCINYALVDHLEEITTEVMVAWDSDERVKAPTLSVE